MDVVCERGKRRLVSFFADIRIDTDRWPATSYDAFRLVQPSPRLCFDSRDRDFRHGPVTENGRPGCRCGLGYQPGDVYGSFASLTPPFEVRERFPTLPNAFSVVEPTRRLPCAAGRNCKPRIHAAEVGTGCCMKGCRGDGVFSTGRGRSSGGTDESCRTFAKIHPVGSARCHRVDPVALRCFGACRAARTRH